MNTELTTTNEQHLRILRDTIYPGAKLESVALVQSYCKARGLDPMKKPVHIVPMKVRDAETGKESYRDVVMPGINEIRTTAFRTGKYAGMEPPKFGPAMKYLGVSVPEYCELTVYRMIGGTRCPFPAVLRFEESCQTKYTSQGEMYLTKMWKKKPYFMLEKCAEAAALRRAFTEELGDMIGYEEMEGEQEQTIHVKPKPEVKPDLSKIIEQKKLVIPKEATDKIDIEKLQNQPGTVTEMSDDDIANSVFIPNTPNDSEGIDEPEQPDLEAIKNNADVSQNPDLDGVKKVAIDFFKSKGLTVRNLNSYLGYARQDQWDEDAINVLREIAVAIQSGKKTVEEVFNLKPKKELPPISPDHPEYEGEF